MSSPQQKVTEALELLPEDLRDRAADSFLSYARKFKQLQAEIQLGLDDVEAGRVVPWDPDDFLKRAREASSR
jgi:predicted transcriptional regulator